MEVGYIATIVANQHGSYLHDIAKYFWNIFPIGGLIYGHVALLFFEA